MKMERIACDRDGDFLARFIAHQDSLPCSLERLQFCSDWLVKGPFSFAGALFACVSDERGDDANNGEDISKLFHGIQETDG